MDHGPSHKKRPGACARCRMRKVRCDGRVPACGNCAKAGKPCEAVPQLMNQSSSQQRYNDIRVSQLEHLLQTHGIEIPATEDRSYDHISAAQEEFSTWQLSLEDSVVSQDPVQQPPLLEEVAADGRPSTQDVPTTLPHVMSPAASQFSHITPQEPIAHEVGMLSLANAGDPKYIGPSSGFSFARLIYAAAPHTQGQPTNMSNSKQQEDHSLGTTVSVADLPSSRETNLFISAYFEAFHCLYPFLDPTAFHQTVQKVSRHDGTTDCIDKAQVFLVLFLGARFLECRLSQIFDAESYRVTAMTYISQVSLHDSVRGIQAMLLLTLASFHSAHGLNAWFLKSTLIASCIDLGLQRSVTHDVSSPSKTTVEENKIRSGTFWSTYSIDRTLSVILGRPLTLRDEAIDIEFPDSFGSDEISRSPLNVFEEGPSKRQKLTPNTPAAFSFRFDRIVAEIKLMLYRVAQSPSRFPWPSDFPNWQTNVHEACTRLLEEMQSPDHTNYGAQRVNVVRDNAILMVELKYHHCIMLLYRPSPGIPRPSALALKFCFESAMETIRIHWELLRFRNHTQSWLDAHTVFMAGITITYCLWVSPHIRYVTPLKLFIHYAGQCVSLLRSLGERWVVALNAGRKFENLVKRTESLWKEDGIPGVATDLPPRPVEKETVSVTAADLNNGGSDAQLLLVDDLDLDWSNLDLYYENTNAWVDELGNAGDWFSLGWIDENAVPRLS